ncbi:MAG: hypothetical protein GVY09_17745 [Gammaproteobacteria bacterium]|jgi:hypothetical protein|nr:hypothetical protein [Gammaproteobacteria bacterium]
MGGLRRSGTPEALPSVGPGRRMQRAQAKTARRTARANAGSVLTAALAALLAASGCTAPLSGGLARGCSAFAADCAEPGQTTATAASRPDGQTRRWVDIDSTPTAAAIYLNGELIGYSPLRHRLGFSSDDRVLSLVAVPLFPGQAQQARLIRVPPLPARVSFFMNNPPAESPDE